MKKTYLSAFLATFLIPFISAAEFQSDFKPFHFSARPAQGSSVDASYLNTPITEAGRIVTGKDGHLYANGKRIRIFGTNISAFPPVEEATYWAKTLASQGINCVRFHHTDSSWADCFFAHDSNGKLYFNEKAFERFDAFFYELKKAGIYSNINLLTGREMSKGSLFVDLPDQLQEVSDWKDRHCYGFWNELAREDQRRYAQKILNHVNPYTGLSYAQDPAVAFVEINNENSMTKAYLDGVLNRFPASLKDEVNQKWTDYLKQKGWTEKKLDSTFNIHQEEKGNILTGRTQLEQYQGAKALLKEDNGNVTIKILSNGTEGWHIQYDFLDFETLDNQIYKLTFKAKASKKSLLVTSVMMNHAPWSSLGFSRDFEVDREWKTYSYVISNLQADSKPRLTFGNMGLLEGTSIHIADLQLIKGGNVTNIEFKNGLVQLPSSDEYRSLPLELRTMIADFLCSIDVDYWTSMNDYLKKEMKIRPLTFGTVISCSPVSAANCFDIIDAHAYWNHPAFPNASWNNRDFYVRNRSLVSAENCGTLAELAQTRVMGKPYSVTEYDHPYPNQFSSEMMPMLAVYASLQDWDCIYSFSYELSERVAEKAKIAGYFSQDSNPAKIAGAPFAARIFREFMIAPLAREKVYNITSEGEVSAIAKMGGAWNVVPPAAFGSKPLDSLTCRVGCTVGAGVGGASGAAVGLGAGGVAGGAGVASSLEQSFSWNAKKGYFVFSNKDVFVSITMPQIQGNFYESEGIKNYSDISFLPASDFAAFTAIKSEKDRWLIFSSSWSGNSDEDLRPYGQAAEKGRGKVPLKTREDIKLTSTLTGSKHLSLALGAEGRVLLAEKAGELYSLKDDGRILRKEKDLTLQAEGGSLWYEVKLQP